MKITACFLSLIIGFIFFVSCSKPSKVPVFFNDSDKVLVGKANEQPPTPNYDWVLLSQGQYRIITTTVNND